ncbi:estradiol 17-beta-dehydrogenase 11-like isoform X1 [Vespa mandarinia]|uniref:estradiol 17-beta-dehydrogenase 11-like isoform X1 n=1 Tax=Vespa mandarinia TaxID=7446 RepID=UPI00161890DA|nr:estradiol 17-beta-dehydrogenase 11-like isoform X1 [Vespa mandarinia]XP_035737895.1 estradiol 17-beta-dehydrogenase 11-like isoform X1 [Vespa mandarinia]
MWIFLPVFKFIISKFIGIMRSIMKLFIPWKYQMKDISGEIALVTGAAGGLGRAIAIGLANHGVIVVIWDINQNGIEETMELIKAAGGTCYGYVCDVRNRDDIYKTAEIVREEVGQVTILINNAGVINIGIFWKTSDDLLSRLMEVNIMSQFWNLFQTVKAFLPAMIESNTGHIVNIASIGGLVGCPAIVDYCASKYSVVGFSEALQLELDFHGHDVSITSVCPTFILNTGMPAAKFSGHLPTVSPQDVAECTVTSIRCNRKIVLVPNYMYFLLFMKWIVPHRFYSKVLRYLMPMDRTEFYPIENQEKYKTHFSNANNVVAS